MDRSRYCTLVSIERTRTRRYIVRYRQLTYLQNIAMRGHNHCFHRQNINDPGDNLATHFSVLCLS